MTELFEPSSLDGHWTQISIVLSLDVAFEFFADFRLPARDHLDFQNRLRNAIGELRKIASEGGNDMPNIRNVMKNHMPPSDIQRLNAWGNKQFLGYHADQPAISAWDVVVSHWAYSRNREIEFLGPENHRWFCQEYKSKVLVDDIRQRSEIAAERPLSDWDLEMYSRHQFGKEWESSPFATIESMVRGNRLIQFLAQFSKRLGVDNSVQVQRSAESLLGEMRVWMPFKLPRLESLLEWAWES